MRRNGKSRNKDDCTLVDQQNGKRTFQNGPYIFLRNPGIKTDKTERQNGIDFIERMKRQNGKRSQNGIWQNGPNGNGETAKRNGKTAKRNGKTAKQKRTKRPVKIETAKCKTVKPKRQNGKTVKTAKRQTVKTVNGKTISFETENGNGQNEQF